MKHYVKKTFAPVVALLATLALTGCYGETLANACSEHGGIRAGSIEQENDGGGEARCNDNTEVENSDSANPSDKNWMLDD